LVDVLGGLTANFKIFSVNIVEVSESRSSKTRMMTACKKTNLSKERQGGISANF